MSSVLQQRATRTALAIACAGALITGAMEATAEVSFKGKTIDVILGSAPGGGTDGTTRLVGTFLEKYLPGNPTMRYRNIPGGHGAKGLNYFAAKVKPDGLGWAGGSSSHTDPAALRKSVVECDPTKFQYFGGVSRGGSIVFIRKEKLANLTDPSKPPVVVGVLDGNRSWEQLITWGKDILNWNVRFVVGYPGTSFLLLAIRRGETHMMATSNLALLQEMFATGDYVGVTQLGDVRDGKTVERTSFETIPAFPKMVQTKLSGLHGEAFNFWSELNDLDKWYALPPATPKDVVEAYRTAWSKIVQDPDFLKQGRLQFSADFTPMTGANVGELVAKTAYPKKEIVAYLDQLKLKHGLPAEPLTDEELAALAKAKGLDKAETAAVKAVLTAVGNGGRDIQFPVGGGTHKADVSSSRTKVSIGGQAMTRGDLKPGMKCAIEYQGDGGQAQSIVCE